MDGYTIHKIALYVKDTKIVKQLFKIPEYSNLLKISDYHYDQIVLLYIKIDWQYDVTNKNYFRLIQSFYRLGIPFDRSLNHSHMSYMAKKGNLKIIKWLHENKKGGSPTRKAMNNAAKYGHLEIVKWLKENIKFD